MSAVTWGNNTVHNIGSTPSPAPVTFGFGAGTPAPTMASPAGSTLFGQPAVTPSTTMQTLQQNVPQQQIPAQAAMQAKISAEQAVETERINNKLIKLHQVYTGTFAVPEDADASAKFCTIVYNDLTPEEIQFRMIHGMTTGYPQQLGSSFNNLQQQQSIFRPPRPPQICGRDWEKAIVENPDTSKYVPTAIVGAIALQARISNQQNRATEYASNAMDLKKNLEFIRQREVLARQELTEKDRQYESLRRRLLGLMKKVEVARCLNQPFQPDEHHCLQRLTDLLTLVEKLRATSGTLQNQAKTQIVGNRTSTRNVSRANDNDMLGVNKKELLSVLTEQERKLQIMADTAKKDLRDVDLIGQRISLL